MPTLFAIWDLGTTITALLGSGGIGYFLSWILRNKKLNQDQSKTTVDEYQELLAAERLERQRQELLCRQEIAAMQAEIRTVRDTINSLFLLYTNMIEANVELYGLVTFYHGAAKRANDRLAEAGETPEKIPDLPPRPVRDRKLEAEILARTAPETPKP